ncbi:MAG: FixH family protein [Flavobacteriales bacterium]
MKINWGTGIAIVIIVFMAFILLMVFKATSTNAELHAQDYYNQELDYQTKIDAIHEAKSLKGNLLIEQTKSKIKIDYPSDFENKTIRGSIHFFKPNNAKLDKRIELKSRQNSQILDKTKFVSGRYQVKISLESEGTTYYFEHTIELK